MYKRVCRGDIACRKWRKCSNDGDLRVFLKIECYAAGGRRGKIKNIGLKLKFLKWGGAEVIVKIIS